MSEAVAAGAERHPRERTGRRWWVLLLTLLAAHAALRVWYAGKAPQLFDESFSIENLRLVLVEGNWEPSSAYYPRLSYLPQTALVAAVRAVEGLAGDPTPLFSGREITPRAFLVCRLLVVAYAVASLLLLFLLARRWLPPATAFLAVALLASTPIHFRLSIEFKPDMLVLALTLLALWLSAIALDRGGWRWSLAAGAATGLAMAAKLTGGGAGLPLAIGTLWRARREPRQLLRLTLAGGTALAVFAAANPDVFRYLRRLFGIVRAYEERPDRRPGGGFSSELLLWLQSSSAHGPVLGVLAVAGLLGMAAMLLVPRCRARLPFSYGPVAIGFPVAFIAVYRLLSGYVKPNNFLPLLPFTALGASWLLVAAWARLERVLPPARGALAVAAGVAAVIVASWPLSAIVASVLFRPVLDVAIAGVEGAAAEHPEHQAPLAVVVEGVTGRIAPRLAAVQPVRDLLAVPPAKLACADAEIFPASRLTGPAAAGYRERMLAGQPLRVKPSLLDLVRGEEVVAVRHPRRPRARQDIPRTGPPPYVVTLPGTLPAGSCVSVAFEIGRGTSDVPRILLDDTELPLRAVRLRGRRLRTTDRIPVPLAPQRLSIGAPGQRLRRGMRLQLLSW